MTFSPTVLDLFEISWVFDTIVAFCSVVSAGCLVAITYKIYKNKS